MANKKFWLGMLVMVLVFGMTIVGCKRSPLEGTWITDEEITISSSTYTFSRGTLTVTNVFMTFIDTETFTYTIRGNNLILNCGVGYETLTFSIDGDRLTINYVHTSVIQTLTRKR